MIARSTVSLRAHENRGDVGDAKRTRIQRSTAVSTEWQFLITLNEQLRPLTHPVAIQEVAVRLIGEHLDASRVHYAHIDGDEFVVSRSYADGVPPLAGRGPSPSSARPSLTRAAVARRSPSMTSTRDPRFTDDGARAAARAQGCSVRWRAADQGPAMACDVLASTALRRGTWTRDQIALVEVTAERTWGAGERARAEEALGRSESRQAFLRRLNDTIRPLADPARILAETCRLLGTHLRVERVAYGEIEGDDCIIVGEYADGLPFNRRPLFVGAISAAAGRQTS